MAALMMEHVSGASLSSPAETEGERGAAAARRAADDNRVVSITSLSPAISAPSAHSLPGTRRRRTLARSAARPGPARPGQ